MYVGKFFIWHITYTSYATTTTFKHPSIPLPNAFTIADITLEIDSLNEYPY